MSYANLACHFLLALFKFRGTKDVFQFSTFLSWEIMIILCTHIFHRAQKKEHKKTLLTYCINFSATSKKLFILRKELKKWRNILWESKFHKFVQILMQRVFRFFFCDMSKHVDGISGEGILLNEIKCWLPPKNNIQLHSGYAKWSPNE